jgi:pimeloyl-ACP methyl ester carboxylesterase
VTEEFIALAMAPKTTDEKHAYWKYFFSPDFVRTHPNQFVSRMEKVITNRSSEQRARRGAQGAFAHDARDRLPSVTNRTLVLAGGEDRIVLPKCGPQLAALIPNARFVVLEGVGHANTIEAPERVADVVRRFLLEP